MTEMSYLYFGPQCPGDALERGGREAAKILGMSFVTYDVCKTPDLAGEYKMFFPGLIVADGLHLVFPGSGQQLAESIRIGGPLPGTQEYQQLPQAVPDRLEILGPDNLEAIRGLCIPEGASSFWCGKEAWLRDLGLSCYGLAAYQGGRPVAIMETLPRRLVPYPVPHYDGLFITCLYGRWDAQVDFRLGLIEAGLPILKDLGFSSIGVVAGRGTPFPNGPDELLRRAGFDEVQDLGRVILRYRWADMVFMQRTI